MEREKKLSILYQKQGRATQFASKASRDQWLKKEIRDYEQVLSSNLVQVINPIDSEYLIFPEMLHETIEFIYHLFLYKLFLSSLSIHVFAYVNLFLTSHFSI